ncbi:short tail fiber protein [Bifidobacterium goeldii]|uniref:Short tail fiber protein n=1 Tax=Bifidobacterium goeldii TaxID=2306975 RepID=A0A430FML2_9BIFI|nr:hypothetical protein [Bifidobacterium goeldii]RSX53931.1 short tail fiber protein [Bifidobacterium goeldii]
MANNQEFQTIATNWIKPDILTKPLPTANNTTQTTRTDGALAIVCTNTAKDGWVQPWNNTTASGMPSGDKIGVLLLSPDDGLTPMGGASLDNGVITWLRGSSAGYQHALIIRAANLANVRLHAPANGRGLVVLKIGLFDLASWEQMQQREIIYFDGGGITTGGNDSYTLPPATTSIRGGVIIGDGLTVDVNGRVSTLVKDLPIATQDTPGVIKEGKGVDITANGTLNVKLGRNLNFDESGAIEAPDITPPDLSDYYTKTETDGRYYTKTESDAKFLPADTDKFYSKTEADAKFATKSTEGTDPNLTAAIKAYALEFLFPVGAIYATMKNTNPDQFIGGSWQQIATDRFLVGAGRSYAASATGGRSSVTLGIANIPKHQHSLTLEMTSNGGKTDTVAGGMGAGKGSKGIFYTSFAGGDGNGNTQPFSILPPYTAVYFWQRIA